MKKHRDADEILKQDGIDATRAWIDGAVPFTDDNVVKLNPKVNKKSTAAILKKFYGDPGAEGLEAAIRDLTALPGFINSDVEHMLEYDVNRLGLEENPTWINLKANPEGRSTRRDADANTDSRQRSKGISRNVPRGPEGKNGGILESAKASTFATRSIQWFWQNRFALGKLGLIGGMPDRGKGLILNYIIAMATTAGVWPCNEGRAIQGNVLLLTAEDDIEDTVKPRLIAVAADLDRVHIVKMVRQGETKRMFSLVTDLPLLRKKIDEVGNVVLIVIDPISAYLGVGKMDSYRTTDVRGVLSPLTDMAAELRLSIIGIMHFNKKVDVNEAMLRIADSLAYVAAARHCYVVLDDLENKRRLFVKAKNNLAPDMAALSYTIATARAGEDADTGEPVYAPHVFWGAEHVNVTATEAMQAETTGISSERPRDAAKQFLQEMLAAGPVRVAEIEEAAKANLISLRTLKRAKKDLAVVAKKDGFGEGQKWTWELPPTPQTRQSNDQR
jgi:putative DNA primase/helicase